MVAHPHSFKFIIFFGVPDQRIELMRPSSSMMCYPLGYASVLIVPGAEFKLPERVELRPERLVPGGDRGLRHLTALPANQQYRSTGVYTYSIYCLTHPP